MNISSNVLFPLFTWNGGINFSPGGWICVMVNSWKKCRRAKPSQIKWVYCNQMKVLQHWDGLNSHTSNDVITNSFLTRFHLSIWKILLPASSSFKADVQLLLYYCTLFSLVEFSVINKIYRNQNSMLIIHIPSDDWR